MTSSQKNWVVLLTTTLVVAAVVLTIFELNGTDREIVELTLRLTAYSSFLLLLRYPGISWPTRTAWHISLLSP
jgi:asparagine N-glycosylation enzyme membrane subunit Stt3